MIQSQHSHTAPQLINMMQLFYLFNVNVGSYPWGCFTFLRLDIEVIRVVQYLIHWFDCVSIRTIKYVCINGQMLAPPIILKHDCMFQVKMGLEKYH